MADAVGPLIDALVASTKALQHTLAGLTDEQARAASLLPGWTRGHVLSHLVGNADAMVNLVTSARTRTYVPMYPGRAERDAAIEAGSGLPAAALVAAVEASHERLMAAITELSPSDWQAPIRYGGADREGVAMLIPELRRGEVEIHHVDLDLGYTIAHWPADFVETMLDVVIADFAERDGTPALTLVTNEDYRRTLAGGGREVVGPAPALLGWLVGRTDGSGLTSDGNLPTLGAWR
jgi:maleylpyruvate isomerase